MHADPSVTLLCSAVFASATAAKLGARSVVGSTSDQAELAVWLDYSATITVGDAVALLAKPAVAAWLDGRVASGNTAVTLQVGVLLGLELLGLQLHHHHPMRGSTWPSGVATSTLLHPSWLPPLFPGPRLTRRACGRRRRARLPGRRLRLLGSSSRL